MIRPLCKPFPARHANGRACARVSVCHGHNVRQGIAVCRSLAVRQGLAVRRSLAVRHDVANCSECSTYVCQSFVRYTNIFIEVQGG